MAEVVHSLTSASGKFRIEVVRRPTGGYQLSYSRYREEHVPEYGFVWEGWVSVPEWVTLADTPERGVALAAEAMALIERQEAESGVSAEGRFERVRGKLPEANAAETGAQADPRPPTGDQAS